MKHAEEPEEDVLHTKILNTIRAGEARESKYGPIVLDLNRRSVFMEGGGAPQYLTSQEYQILWLLVRAQGTPITRAEIEQFIYEDKYGEKDFPIADTIAVNITHLREKLEAVTGGKIFIPYSRPYTASYKLELRQD